MPLTREFKETVSPHQAEPQIPEGTPPGRRGVSPRRRSRYGKAILRDYINGTIGFEELSRVTKRPAKKRDANVRA
jgi:hypothetical protein